MGNLKQFEFLFLSTQRSSKVDLQADAPFEFALEIELGDCPKNAEEIERSIGATLGFHQEEGDVAVRLSVDSGQKSISLSLNPDDIDALKTSVDLLHKRISADNSTIRADTDQSVDCA